MIRLILFFVVIVILWDFFKDPIDLYYFRNPMRIFIAFENFFMDLLYYQPTYDTTKFKILKNNLENIKKEFENVSETLPKSFPMMKINGLIMYLLPDPDFRLHKFL